MFRKSENMKLEGLGNNKMCSIQHSRMTSPLYKGTRGKTISSMVHHRSSCLQIQQSFLPC